jgi:3-phosphoshikimate 1-carboxyvinyltransferase
MRYIVTRSDITGEVAIPGSKSHTIRAVFFASLAEGESVISAPLLSSDTESAIRVCRGFGAEISQENGRLLVRGFAGKPRIPEDILNVDNSGTTLRIALSTAALIEGYSVFTGDDQIRNRPLGPLVKSLNELGASVVTTLDNGKAPVIVKGKAKGGRTELKSVSSQYLTSLLINAPLFERQTEIVITELNERPYVEMTLAWLDEQKIRYENHGFKRIVIEPNQSYAAFRKTIPADFSSASFFLALGALSEKPVTLRNLSMSDTQGDKRVVSLLRDMGADVRIEEDAITVQGGRSRLHGITVDMNDIPDALPVMAVVGCFAEGVTELCNVPQARLKETDRISVMRTELSRLGASIEEKPDGLVIRKSSLKAGTVSGHADHRIVMALSVAGLQLDGETTIDTAESVRVTFPDFADLIHACGGKLAIRAE